MCIRDRQYTPSMYGCRIVIARGARPTPADDTVIPATPCDPDTPAPAAIVTRRTSGRSRKTFVKAPRTWMPSPPVIDVSARKTLRAPRPFAEKFENAPALLKYHAVNALRFASIV